MVWDTRRQHVRLVGGTGAGGDGTEWTQRTTTETPGFRYGHTIVDDAAAQRILLFGGVCASPSTSVMYCDTWQYGALSPAAYETSAPAARAAPERRPWRCRACRRGPAAC